MKKLLILILALTVAQSAFAKNANTQAINDAKIKWENLTPEQQNAVRANAEQVYKNMTPAERANLEDRARMLSRQQKSTLKEF